MQGNNYKYLGNINSPAQLKMIDPALLKDLCAEIRHEIISTVSQNGGHLASNLGTVELTVALHRCFDSPDDKIVFDVGHQAYTHKLLTGRFDRFASLRKENGISGFTRPDESEHDASFEGHAGTSVSRAAGIAAGLKIKGSKHYSIAVVGDGSLGNGMIYEAMNHAGTQKNGLIVILNDNEMSISENVGAMARYLAIVRAKPEYYRLKAGTEKALRKIPLVGVSLSNHFYKVKTILKNIIYSSSFFEDLGFKYIGPIDGHDINTLCEAMNSAKFINGPVLIHINTKKGYGYEFAETEPEKFHGISKFNIETGEPKPASDTFSSVFGKKLCEFASKDKRICALTAAMSIGTGLEEFSLKFTDRFFDVGIAEEHAVTFASGLAISGMIPVFAVYSTFAQRCVDQVIHDGALQRRKMIIAVDRAGFVGEDGETHQGLFDVSLFNSIPNVTIYSPSNYFQLEKALYLSLYKDENIVIIRYPRGSEICSYGELSNDYFDFYGYSEAKVTFVSYGRTASFARDIIDTEHKAKLIELFRIKPVEDSVYDILMHQENIVFLEEGIKNGGIGQTVGATLLEKGFSGGFRIVAVDDRFVAHASTESQFKQFGLDPESVIHLIEETK